MVPGFFPLHRNGKRRTFQNLRAFTLFELLIAALLFSAGVLSVFQMVHATQVSNRSLWNQHKAMLVLQSTLQEMMLEEMSPGSSMLRMTIDGVTYTVDYRVIPNEESLNRIRLTITYPLRDKAASLSLETVHYATT